jgi:predicted RNase H-like HicB family nuclease
VTLFDKTQRSGRYTRLVSDPLHLTILYEEGEDGWIVVSIPEVPGVLSQGKTREEAREMVLDALAGMLELRAAEHKPQGKAVGSESLDIVAA